MNARVGIELSPVACRIVELEGLHVVPGRAPATRVRSYSVLPPSGPETNGRFASLARRQVAVVVWGVRSEHRQVVVANGSYEKMRAEALAAARVSGAQTRGTLADIASASTAIKGARRQPVVLALANADDVSMAVRPLIDARVRIRSVITPADALLGLARSRQAFAVPGGIEAYVALDATVTCVALVRDGSLLSARELEWGYEDASGAPAASRAGGALPRRDDLAARLVGELEDFLTWVGAESNALTQVSICGGLPELRTMTIPLMENLDVEVETLDSLFGIDVAHLPEPADEFRERAAELRLAWAAAADWRGPINLMRHRARRERRVALARAAVVAGVVAGLGAGWSIQQSAWWRSTSPKSVARTTPALAPSTSRARVPSPPAPRPQAPAVAQSKPTPPSPTEPVASPAIPIPLTATPTAPVTASKAPSLPTTSVPPVASSPPPSLVSAVSPERTASSTSTTSTAGRAITAPKPTVMPAPMPSVALPPPATRAPVAVPPAPRAIRPAPTTPLAVEAGGPVASPGIPVAAPVVPPPVPPERPARPAAAAPPVVRRPEPPPLPFDAVLGTILYSPERKLAIINGRIVSPGDEVNGARIVDITETTVVLRDAQGRLRNLTLGGRTPPTP